MKKLYTTLVLVTLVISTFAQTPNISMTTTLSINSQISFTIRGNSSSTPIQIDWGNGTKVSYTIGDMDEAFGFPVKGSTIKIWGQGVEGLNIQSKELTAMEFYQATSFKTLFCKGNKLTTLNLSDCPALTLVECKQNLISSLTLPNTSTLTYVDCSDNNLTLSTLPIKQANWTDYIYSPQKDYTLAKTVYAVNEEINLSNQLTVNGNTTSYTWKTVGGATLTNGVDYNVTGGKFTFLKTYSESIYCEMANSTFPSLTIKTISIAILNSPSIEMTTSNTVESSFSFIIRSAANNSTAFVDWGDGTLTTHNVFTSNSYISGTLKGSTIKVFGDGIVYIDVNSKNLSNINVTKCPSLKYFFCNGNQLTSIDVSKNIALINLNCSYNRLTSLDVSNNTLLWNLDCDNNTFPSLDVTKNTALAKLDCGRATLCSLDITKNTALTELYCAANNLTQLDVSKNTSLSIINCYENKLTSLALDNISTITEVRCYGNNLFFSTLPVKQITWSVYSYSPQAKMVLQKKNYTLTETIDLSSQLSINGNTTTYTWRTKSGQTLANGSDYTESNGTFSFIKGKVDSIYCELRNSSFPALVLETSAIKIPFPTVPNISMVTSNAINSSFSFIIRSILDNTTAYVDWGDGTTTSYNIFSSNSYISGTLKGSTIKVFGDGLVYIDVNSKNLSTINVTNCPSLKYFFCNGNQFTSIDISKNIALINFNCSYNNLTSLDVSNNTALTYLNCNNNQLTSLDVSKNTALKTLDCDNNKLTTLNMSYNTALTYLSCNNNKLTALNVSNNTALTYLNCFYNQLATIDVANNTALTQLHCSNNFLSTIDLSKNTNLITLRNFGNNLSMLDLSNNIALTYLDCSWNKLVAIDVTKNTALIEFDCSSNNQIATLDLSKNTALTRLVCANNKLTLLDISMNISLQALYCYNNQLSTLDITNNNALTSIDCSSNFLKFNTLPLKQSTWTYYYYNPQNELTLPKKNYTLSETIDLSNQLTINSKTTTYIWKTKGGTTLTSGFDYSLTGGVTTFLKPQTDSIYCQMTNATFPSLTLSTTNIKVTDPTSADSDLEQITKVYPNPISNQFWVESEEMIKRVEIYTVVGTKIFEQDYSTTQKVNINSAEFPKGLLIIKVYGANGVMEKKIFKE